MLLIDVRKFHRFTHFKGSGIRLFEFHNEAEECSLTSSVRTNHTNNTVGREHEVEVIEQLLRAKSLGNVLRFYNLVTQTRTIGDKDFEFLFLFLLVFTKELIVRVQTCLTLCLTCLRRHAHPFQFAFQSLAALACHLFFHLHTLRLLLQP